MIRDRLTRTCTAIMNSSIRAGQLDQSVAAMCKVAISVLAMLLPAVSRHTMEHEMAQLAQQRTRTRGAQGTRMG